MTKKISILGSTGSIGTQSLDVAEKRGYHVQVLTAGSNAKLLEEQIRKWKPKYAALADEKAAKDGIEKMAEYFGSIGMPLQLREFGIENTSMETLAELCTFGKQRTVRNYIELDFDRIKEIFESCY